MNITRDWAKLLKFIAMVGVLLVMVVWPVASESRKAVLLIIGQAVIGPIDARLNIPDTEINARFKQCRSIFLTDDCQELRKSIRSETTAETCKRVVREVGSIWRRYKGVGDRGENVWSASDNAYPASTIIDEVWTIKGGTGNPPGMTRILCIPAPTGLR